MNDAQARERVAQVDALLERIDTLPDPAARDLAMELVQALLAVYGEGLSRVLAQADGLAEGLANDELVAHLMLLHGLHPVSLPDRVTQALDEVRPYLATHGGDVELLGVTDDGIARLRLKGSCSGCPSSAITLKSAVEEAIHKAAPDLEDIVAEDDPAPAGPAPLLQIDLTCPVPLPQVR
jgi:Fe-S cluster biogenesis protein NfuA